MQIDRGVVERQRQQLQIVAQRQQSAGEFDGRGRVDVAPECGVRWIFALHGVVADELEGELVVAHQHLGGKRECRFEQGVVLVARTVGV